MKLDLHFKYHKDTPGTYRFAEVHEQSAPPIVGTLYIKKYAISGTVPEKLKVTIEEE